MTGMGDKTEKESGGSPAKFVGVNVLLIIGLAIGISLGQRAEIIANWPSRRCDPGVVASAYLYKPISDTRTIAEFTSENFQFCQGKLAKDVISTVTIPVKVVQEQQKGIIGAISSNISVLGSLGEKLAGFFNQLMDSVRRRFAATYVHLGESFQHLLNIMGKIMASITAMAMALIGVLVTFTTMIQFALYVLAIIIGILIALMVIFAAFLAPVSWLVFAGIAVVGILTGIIVGVITASAFCISGDTPVILADGSTKPLRNVRVGESLADGGVVTATMRFLVPPTKHEPLVSIHGVVMSPEHMLFGPGPGSEPIAAKDHPDALSAGVKRELYNLNTNNRTIPVLSSKGKLTLLDYEEIADGDTSTLAEWKKHVFGILNPGQAFVDANPENVEAGISGALLVNTSDGGMLPVSEIVCGDRIECPGGYTMVCGKVELIVDEDELLYDGFTVGVWVHDSTKWGFPTGPQATVGKRHLYHLFTESGDFIVNGYRVRDFSEVGLDCLSGTYKIPKKIYG